MLRCVVYGRRLLPLLKHIEIILVSGRLLFLSDNLGIEGGRSFPFLLPRAS